MGCSPRGRLESDTTERLHFHFSLSCIGEGNGNPLQCSCLENPRDGGAWWAAVSAVAQSRTRLKRLSSSSSSSSPVWGSSNEFSAVVLTFFTKWCHGAQASEGRGPWPACRGSWEDAVSPAGSSCPLPHPSELEFRRSAVHLSSFPQPRVFWGSRGAGREPGRVWHLQHCPDGPCACWALAELSARKEGLCVWSQDH